MFKINTLLKIKFPSKVHNDFSNQLLIDWFTFEVIVSNAGEEILLKRLLTAAAAATTSATAAVLLLLLLLYF